MAERKHCPKCGLSLAELRKALPGGTLNLCVQCRFPLAVIANKYQLERELGEGGFGVVYLARHIYLEEEAERVIKVLKPDVFKLKGMQKRFFREVQLTSRLSQKEEHIVRIYDDFGEIPYLGHYYVMERLRGAPLSEALAQHKKSGDRLPLPTCFHIFRQLLRTMQFAHESGVIHRDLKPDNLFLIQHKGDPHFLKVLDFGIARPTNQGELEQTQVTQGAIGTPYYMSPEQCQNLPVDECSDIYAMGIILYELLTGQTPFQPVEGQETSLMELLVAHSSRPPPSPRQLAPERVDVGLEAILLKSLRKEPSERYTSAKEFYYALEEVIASRFPQQTFSSLSFEDLPGVLSADAALLPSGDLAFEETHAHAPPPPMPGAPHTEASRLPAPSNMGESEASLTPSRPMWLAALAALLLLAGGSWLGIRFLAPPKTPAPKTKARAGAAPQHSAATRHPTSATPQVPTAQRERTSPQQPSVRRSSPKRKRAQPLITRRRAAPPVRRKRVVPRRRPRLRKGRKGQSTPGCPLARGKTRWVRLHLAPKRAKLSLKPKHTRIQRKGSSICLALRGAAEVSLEAPGYWPCSFRLPHRAATRRVRLRQEKINELEPVLHYCLQR